MGWGRGRSQYQLSSPAAAAGPAKDKSAWLEWDGEKSVSVKSGDDCTKKFGRVGRLVGLVVSVVDRSVCSRSVGKVDHRSAGRIDRRSVGLVGNRSIGSVESVSSVLPVSG